LFELASASPVSFAADSYIGGSTLEGKQLQPMRAASVCCSSLLAAAALSLAVLSPAGADVPAPAAPAALDATHFVVVRGDRLVIYEVDPKKGYDLRVVNSALVDESGRIVGQFRPETAPAASPPAVAPGPEPAPPVESSAPLPYFAKREMPSAPHASMKGPARVAHPHLATRRTLP
jgi:hypothetical protein